MERPKVGIGVIIKKEGKVTVFVSAKWKYEFFTKLKKYMKKTRNFKELLAKFDKNKGEIVKLIQMVLKDESRMPLIILSQDEEFKIMKQNKFNVERAEKSKEKKALQAMPGKVGVLVT